MYGYTFVASSRITHFPGVLVQQPKHPVQLAIFNDDRSINFVLE